MASYTIRCTDATGAFVCGMTLNCRTDSEATARFSELPLSRYLAVLLKNGKPLARREPNGASAVSAARKSGSAQASADHSWRNRPAGFDGLAKSKASN